MHFLKHREVIISFIFLLVLTSPFLHINKSYSATIENLDWSYQGKTGPNYWSYLDPSFIQCEIGALQSPINIDTTKVIQKENLEEIKVQYTTSEFSIIKNRLTLKLLPKDESNYIYVGNIKYVLKQLHFHYPSEHGINGKKFPAEIHLVHQNRKEQLAVIGLLVEKGKENIVIMKFFNGLTKDEGKIEVVKEKINIENLLPEKREYYRYEGSLTTPPCSEGVKWLLLDQPIQMSEKQIEKLREFFPTNMRPLQSIGKRKIFFKR